MSDESASIARVNRYAILLDDGDVDGVVALFEEATWRSDRGDVVRHQASAVRPVYGQPVAATGTTRTRHRIADLTVTVVPDGTSTTSPVRTAGGRSPTCPSPPISASLLPPVRWISGSLTLRRAAAPRSEPPGPALTGRRCPPNHDRGIT